ncbi:thioredoxin-like domain-containing protein [Pedobacter helvus]|uniref:Thioredoxin-like domain-containing protein n=1 Tax=Pedobacter helvus TaxID=2563444 RepID=A0ABW9JFS2_9SPHI|nr:TlpA disulfide reductase family protein [Pedobacter ureilyticus]
MNFKKIILLSFAIFPLLGFAQSVPYRIEGKVNPTYHGRFIKLIYTPNNGTKKVDSTQINEGEFVFTGQLNRPTAAKITLGSEDQGDRIDLFLSDGTVRVNAKDSIRYANINGTELAATYEKLAKVLRPLDDDFMSKFLLIKTMPEGEAKKAYTTKMLADLDAYGRQRREIVHRFVLENPSSYVSLYLLDKGSPGKLMNYEATNPYYAKLSKTLKETPLGKEFGERLMASKGALTGEKYIDFVSTTPEGTKLSLKEVLSKNKYTLVDFWASWCGPCRKENPNVVKAFDAFKDKGFTVLSVSLDDNAAKWKEAIEKDGMPWYHVSSLMGWKEPAAALYGIRAIPQNVLVDAQGKIVATNLRAETLYNKIESLLN